MFYVYILKSIPNPDRQYVGFTANLERRLEVHNSGESYHTLRYKPWSMEVYFAFKEETRAVEFEKYLKSGSGRTFAKRHFL